MIIHTIIDPLDIFYEEPKQPEAQNSESFSTDPYFFLQKDEYYKNYIQKAELAFLSLVKNHTLGNTAHHCHEAATAVHINL